MKQNRLLRGLSPTDSRWVEGLFRRETIAPGGVLIEEGRPNGRLFLLDSGSVRLARKLNYAQTGFVSRLEPGAFFGDVSVLDNVPALEEAAAIGMVGVRVIEQAGLMELLDTDCAAAQQILRNILSVLLERQRDLEERFTAYAAKVSLLREYTAD